MPQPDIPPAAIRTETTSMYAAPPTKQVGRLARHGARWTMGLTILRQGFGVVATAVLARLLSPSDFGLIAMAIIFTGFLGLFDLSLGWTTVQAETVDAHVVNHLFWIGAVWGILLWAICALVGPLMARFYGQPELVGICVAAGAGGFINSLTTQPAAILKRKMRQRMLSVIETAAVLLSSAIAILLALLGWGYWALAGQYVLLPFFRFVALVASTRFRLIWPQWKKINPSHLKFTSYMAPCHWVTYLHLNYDSILVGLLSGPASLGSYSRALHLKNLPSLYSVQPLNDVMIPAVAALHRDPVHLGRAYLKALEVVAFVGCPIGAFLGVAAPELVQLLYGPAWAEVTPLLQWLSPAAVAWPIYSTAAWIFIGAGRARIFFWMNMLLTLAICAIYSVVAERGTLALAIAHGLMFGTVIPLITVYCAHREVGLSFRPTVRVVTPILAACLIASAIALGVCCFVAPLLAWPFLLLVKGAVGGSIYLLFVRLFLGRLPNLIRSL